MIGTDADPDPDSSLAEAFHSSNDLIAWLKTLYELCGDSRFQSWRAIERFDRLLCVVHHNAEAQVDYELAPWSGTGRPVSAGGVGCS